MKRPIIYILIGGLCLGLFSACTTPLPPVETKATYVSWNEGDENTTESLPDAADTVPEEMAEDDGPKFTVPGITDPIDPEKVSRIVFDYDSFSGSQFEINAIVTDITSEGALLQITKTVGPMNYTGSGKEGKVLLNKRQTEKLLDILCRYDIKRYSSLQKRGSGSSPSRSIWVFEGEQRYAVSFDTIFPAPADPFTPPEEDIMYFELFNFFNGVIRNEPGWEEVRSDDLPDPRQNPAYGERIVEHFGHEVKLVPGTGVDYEDGRSALIDYGDRIWWLEEGFTGSWTMSADDREYDYKTCEDAKLSVDDAGRAVLTLDGVEWKGSLGYNRYYMEDIAVLFEDEKGRRRVCEIMPLEGDSYEYLRVRCYPGPVPEPQFVPIDVLLTKAGSPDGDVKDEEEAEMTENTQSPEVWRCRECGAENNTSDYCDTCGAPRSGFKFMKDQKWPEDGHYPTLDEVRAKEEQHGELKEVMWSSSSMGMMMGDISNYSMSLSKEDGAYILTEVSMPSYQPVITTKYHADEEVFDRIREIAERENLSAWQYLRVDQSKKMMIFDYSSNAALTLIYDDTGIGGWKDVRLSIDREAAEQQGGGGVLLEVSDLLLKCRENPDNIISVSETPNPYLHQTNTNPVFMGTPPAPDGKEGFTGEKTFEIAEDGTWTCPACGETGISGKFCPECGSLGPKM